MSLRLDGLKSGELYTALMDAFGAGNFQRIVLHRLNLEIYDFVPLNADRSEMVFETIERTNQLWRTDELIAAAREANPTNSVLHEFSQQFGLTSLKNDKPVQEYQRIVTETSSFLNPASWRTKLAEIENRVCRIEIQSNEGLISGTGFLLGSNVVLTNYHVVEVVIKGEKGETTEDGLSAKRANVKCRFDYKRSADNTVLNKGVTYQLDADWLVDSSPSFPLDQLPPKDCLDYALLRLSGTPGKDIVGNMPSAAGAARGWIPVPQNPHEFKKDSPVFIMQHPKGSPLKLAFETNGVIELNENETRLKHRVNTEEGSSGSPCFSQNWDLVALHHSGDPDFTPENKPAYNEAIPIAAILDLMTGRGIDAHLNV